MKVIHVVPAIADRYGGPSKAAIEMCRSLQDLGIQTLIVATNADGPGTLSLPLGRTIQYRDVDVMLFSRQLSEAFKYSYPLARWLEVHVGGFDLAHIHAVFSHSSIAAARACSRVRVPYLVRPLGSLDPWSMSQSRWRKKLAWHWGVDRMLAGAATVHYTTEEEKRRAEESLGLSGGSVVPLGVPSPERLGHETTGAAEAFRSRFGGLDSHPYILALGRLHPKKGLENLIEVFASLGEAHGEWRLVIAGSGDGRYEHRLRARAAKSGVAERIVFTGWLDGSLKQGALEGAEIAALPSLQENFAISVVEAMACSTPVIISDSVNLAPEVAAADAGWITATDGASLRRTLAAAMDNSKERSARGRAARRLADDFTWSRIAPRLEALYESVLSTDSPTTGR